MTTKHHLLEDARTLAYMEFGDPEGHPVFYAHGGPGSRLEGEWFDRIGKEKGFRIIATDRPGHGESTYLDERVLLDHPRDLVALANALGIAKFGVIGWSGGGIHATICAYAIPDRLLFDFSFAGYTNWAEMPDAASYLHSTNKLDKLAVGISKSHPLMFRFFFEMMNASEKLMPETTYGTIVKEMNDTDKAIAAIPDFKKLFIRSQKEAFKQGGKGATRDARIHYDDWGIRLEQIEFPIHVFHGTEDHLVPIEFSRHIADHVKDCTLHVWEGEGHLAPHDHMNEIFELAESEIAHRKELVQV